jgi:glutathione S-transferase
MSETRIVFYDWPYSPFCMKVRAILDYKGLAYERVNPLAARRTLQRRGTGKVPAVEIDGVFVTDSTEIAHALDERFPDPPLMPSDPREWGLCQAIEEWADEGLYFLGLYYRWFDRAGRAEIPAKFGTSLKGRLVYRFYLKRILGQLWAQGTLRKGPEHVARDLDRNLDAAQRLLAPGPYLLGDQPFLCDFALWGQLAYLARTPVGREAVAARPAVTRFVETRFQLTAASS